MLRDFMDRVIRKLDLKKPQGEPGLTGVRPIHPGAVAPGLTPQRLASVLAAADRGDIREMMILAEEMEERDPHYASVLGQRKRAISGVQPTVQAASEDARDKEIAEWVERHIANHDGMTNLIEDLLDAVGKGFSAVEIEWQTNAEEWTPRAFKYVHQSYFCWDRETGSELLLKDEADVEGVSLKPGKWLVHYSRIKSGAPWRGGVARVAVFAWMCKAYTLKDWMAWIETYGLPLRVGKYGHEASKADIRELFRAVANIGTDAAAVIPEGMSIEFIDGSKGGKDPVFENFARWADEQLSKIVIGQTMTTDNGSSNAQAKVHNDVRYDIAASDARAIEGLLNQQLVRIAVDFNFGVPPNGYPKLDLAIAEPEDIASLSAAVSALAGAGLSFSASAMRRRLGFQDPEDDEETFGGSLTPPAPPPAVPGTARLSTARGADDPNVALDRLVDDVAADWRDGIDPFIAPILAAADASPSIEEFQLRLAAIEGLPKGPLIDQLVKGMFQARALGDGPDA